LNAVSVPTDPVPALPDRKPGLDLIRASAIGWVMLYHASIFDLVPDPDHWFITSGWMGVDMFFVLSGYLIAGQLLRPIARGGHPDYRRFAVRRLLRTMPAYMAVLAVYAFLPDLREREAMQPLWQFATFTVNLLLDPARPSAFSHVWSLCVEEQFYLVLPLALWFLSARRHMVPSLQVGLLAGLVALGIALRGYLWLARVAETPFTASAAPDAQAYMKLIYYPTWSRLDGLLAGIALAAIEIFRPVWWHWLTRRANALVLLGCLGMTVSIRFFDGQIAGLYASMFAFPLLAWSIALIVVSASCRESWIGRWRIPGARMLATGAYSLYLSHKLAFHIVANWQSAPDALRLAAAFMLAFVLGTALYLCVERPGLKWREHLTRRGPAVPLSPTGALTPPTA